jgi:molecular chaperone GrpE (heat shock protein)
MTRRPARSGKIALSPQAGRAKVRGGVSIFTNADWTTRKTVRYSPRRMNQTAPRLSKLPFLVGDLLLIGTAGFIAVYGSTLGHWQFAVVAAAVALGAWLAVWPFILEFRAATKLAESAVLADVTAKIQDLNKVSASIASAILEWQQLQQSGTQTVTAAQHIAEQMTAEARNFGEVMSKLHESEKNHLRLEVEKLRRAEGEWLGVAVRTLDHVHALHQAGLRSGQRNVIEQLTSFQNACRETARRIGLVPVVPEPGIPFDEKAHQLLEGAKAANGARVDSILAPGYTFQGQVIRLPVVAVSAAQPAAAEPEDAQLSFDAPAR